MDVTLRTIEEHLKKGGHTPVLQEETKQIMIVIKEENREFPTFFRIFDSSDLLQIISFFPFQIPKQQIPQVARLLHLLNKELDIPGFGLDEMTQVSFFRVMLNTPQKKISTELIDGYIKTGHLVCKTFVSTIEAVAAGKVNVDEILAKAQTAGPKMKA